MNRCNTEGRYEQHDKAKTTRRKPRRNYVGWTESSYVTDQSGRARHKFIQAVYVDRNGIRCKETIVRLENTTGKTTYLGSGFGYSFHLPPELLVAPKTIIETPSVKQALQQETVSEIADALMDDQKSKGQRGRKPKELSVAITWLLALLACGRKFVTEIYEAAKKNLDENGVPLFSERTIDRAKAELGIKAMQIWCKETDTNKWVWYLPATPECQK